MGKFGSAAVEMQQYGKVQQLPIVYWSTNAKNLSLNQLQDEGREKFV